MAAYKRRRSFVGSRPSKRRKMYKRTRRVFKRRTQRSRRKGVLARYSGGRNLYGIPSSKLVQCIWVGSETLTVPENGDIIFGSGIKVNSAFDPWNGNVLNQWNDLPGGFKFYSKLYGRYIVCGARLVVVARNPKIGGMGDAAAQYPYKFGIRLDRDTTNNATEWDNMVNAPFSRMKTIHWTDTSRYARISINYSPKKFWGIKDYKDVNAGDLGAQVSTNPTRTCNANVWVQKLEKDNSVNFFPTVHLEYKLFMSVLFTERLDPYDFPTDGAIIQVDA